MKKFLWFLIAALWGWISLLGFTHAQSVTTTQTQISEITVPATVSSDVVTKVTDVAPLIMSLIDQKGGYGSVLYYTYIDTLTTYAERFTETGDEKRAWIANTLLAYAYAYYDVNGEEVVVIEQPVTNEHENEEEEENENENENEEPKTIVSTDYDDLQELLDDMAALWDAQWVINYTMVQQLGCYCTSEYTRPVVYEIENNRVEQSTANYYNWARESVDVMNSPQLFTIDQHFTNIQQAINDGAASIEVEFDGERWYPTSISIDFDAMIADEEKYYVIEVFESSFY